MPSNKRRKELHWKRVQRNKEKKQQQIDSVLEETVEGQALKPIDTDTDTYEMVRRVPRQSAPARSYCTIS